MAGHLTLLGVAPADDAARLEAALRAIPGPLLSVHRSAAVAVFAQTARADGGGFLRKRSQAAALRALQTVQRRLEIACQAGPFLPMYRAAAVCPGDMLARLVDEAEEALEQALARDGGRHQWDVVLRWPAEPVVAARRALINAAVAEAGASREVMAEAVAAALRDEQSARAAALRAALAPRVLAIANADMAASETETALTVLIPRGGEAAIEAALMRLPPEMSEGASADLRGPLPPVSFSPCRILSSEPADVTRAWALLGLPDRVDPAALTRHWRALAFRLHPDRQGPGADGAPLAEAGRAHRLLQDLMRAAGPAPCTRAKLLRLAGPRLVPAPPTAAPATPPDPPWRAGISTPIAPDAVTIRAATIGALAPAMQR